MRGPPNGPMAGSGSGPPRRRPHRAGRPRACRTRRSRLHPPPANPPGACAGPARTGRGHLDATRRQTGRHPALAQAMHAEAGAGQALQHRHQVVLRLRRFGQRGGRFPILRLRPRHPLGRAAAATLARGVRPRHDVEVLQVLVQIGVDGVDVAERALVELLQDRELEALVGLDRLQRLAERLDDGRRRQRIGFVSRSGRPSR